MSVRSWMVVSRLSCEIKSNGSLGAGRGVGEVALSLLDAVDGRVGGSEVGAGVCGVGLASARGSSDEEVIVAVCDEGDGVAIPDEGDGVAIPDEGDGLTIADEGDCVAAGTEVAVAARLGAVVGEATGGLAQLATASTSTSSMTNHRVFMSFLS
jgi:hypothetical protein